MCSDLLEAIVDGKRALLHHGRPLSEVPNTYNKIKTVSHNMGNNYNPSTLTIYEDSSGGLKYEIYRDGCFDPFYGIIEFPNEDFK